MNYKRGTTFLFLEIIFLQGTRISCSALPSTKMYNDSDAKSGPSSILPEMEEEEFLENNGESGSEETTRSNLMTHLLRKQSPTGRSSRSSPESPAANAAPSSQPPVESVSVDDVTDAVEDAAAEDTLERPEAGASTPAASGGGAVRADAGGSGLPLAGLVPQGLPSVPGLPFGGQGVMGAPGAGNQQLPTLFLGGFQVMRMPMPSATDMLGMMQALPSLMQGAPNLMQGVQGLQLPALPGAAG